jgi:hypothetical protein
MSPNIQNHIIIQAAAGTGKTTSSLAIPYFAPKDRFLLLTFNNELCGNTKKRVQFDWGLEKNTDVYTFHGFMNLYFGTCQNDIDLYELLSKPNLEPRHKMPRWARVCLDEFQDANYGIYAISQLILYWQNKLYPPSKTGLPAVQLIIMGDTLQCLYEYAGADRRFITLAHLIYNNPSSSIQGCKELPPTQFTQLALTQTFRCTKPMVDFINKVMLGYPKMISDKPGIKPQIHVVNIFEITQKHPLVELVLGLIKKANRDYGQIAIISRNVRANQTITKLANILTAKGVPLYISANETDTKNEKRLSQGKLVITSVHKSKGREWPYVVVLGFDDYFKKRDSGSTDEKEYFAEHNQRLTCPDVAYVAVSRAESELHLIQHYMNGLPKYINHIELPKYADIQEHIKRPTNTSQIHNSKPIIYKASEISRHMDTSVIWQAIRKLGLQNINSPGKGNQIIGALNEYIAPDGTIEDTSAINGVAVPVWYECHYRKTAPEILGMINKMLGTDNGKLFAKYYNPEWHVKAVNKRTHEYTVRDVLQMANLYIGLRDGYLYLCRQLESSNWDWITVAQLNESARRINEVIHILAPEVVGGQKLQFEKMASNKNMHISGCIDLYTPMTVFEFKFKSKLSTEDILQTAISMLLGHEIGIGELFNTIDNMIDARLESLDHIKPGHTILALQPKSTRHIALQVISKLDDGKLACRMKQSANNTVTSESNINDARTININLHDVLADLTWLKQNGVIHDKQGILFNIKTEELIRVTAKWAQLEEMLGIILKEKELMNSGKHNKPTDAEFLQRCLEIQSGIWSGSGI